MFDSLMTLRPADSVVVLMVMGVSLVFIIVLFVLSMFIFIKSDSLSVERKQSFDDEREQVL